MNSTPGPFDIPLACMKMANVMFHSNLKVMQIVTQTALEAPFAQVRTLRAAASGPAAEISDSQIASQRSSHSVAAKASKKPKRRRATLATGRKPAQAVGKPASAPRAKQSAARKPIPTTAEAKPTPAAPRQKETAHKPRISAEKPAPTRKRSRQPSRPSEMPDPVPARKD